MRFVLLLLYFVIIIIHFHIFSHILFLFVFNSCRKYIIQFVVVFKYRIFISFSFTFIYVQTINSSSSYCFKFCPCCLYIYIYISPIHHSSYNNYTFFINPWKYIEGRQDQISIKKTLFLSRWEKLKNDDIYNLMITT